VDKKEIIINSAVKRFRHYGISKTTMQDIATDANLAVGTLYLYFKNKDEIVIACADEFRKEHLKASEQILNSSFSASEKIRQYILNRFIANQHTRIGFPHAIEITKAVIRLKPDRIAEETEWLIQNILKMLLQGIEKKEFKIENPEEDTEVFLYSIAYFFPLATYEVVKEPEEEILLKVVNWFINKWTKD
jgi:AcrR family transcriptional regulator